VSEKIGRRRERLQNQESWERSDRADLLAVAAILAPSLLLTPARRSFNLAPRRDARLELRLEAHRLIVLFRSSAKAMLASSWKLLPV